MVRTNPMWSILRFTPTRSVMYLPHACQSFSLCARVVRSRQRFGARGERQRICHDRRGGLNIGLRKGMRIRLVQADWLMTKFDSETQNSQGRVSAGIVIKF